MKEKSKQPLVSVIIPSYNHEKYIKQSIESIINQTYTNFELIVIDDGSLDNSPIILKELQEKYGFILELQENIGVRATLNKALQKYVKGKYVTYCSSDDFFTPKRLEIQVAFMEEHPECPMSYGKTYVVNENGEINNEHTKAMNTHLKGGDIFKDLLTLSFNLPVTYMFQTSIFSKIGYYKEDIWTEDYYMCLKIASQYKIGFIDEFIYNYREINLSGKLLSLKSLDSVLTCINEYQYSEYYPIALRNWYFMNFAYLASTTRYKRRAIKGLYYSKNYFYRKSYWFAICKLILLWK